ncbi:MAG: alpha/beta hydrolase [Enterobacterales bacterium]|nr:alpha/beta hydrolase [Enterobacterales bacterium]
MRSIVLKLQKKAKPDTPPIFYLHGGPGFEGLESELSILGEFEKNWQPMLDISDVVVVSQRGTGPSKPTITFGETLKMQPLDQTFNEDKLELELRQILTREKIVWEQSGYDFSSFKVSEMATDVKAVMQALGYKKIILWGGSFGSHWGIAIMRYYPNIVARAIFRGLEGPDHTYDHPGHIWNVYKRIAEEAEKSEELRDFIPKDGLIQAVKTIITRADKNPVKVIVTDNENNRYDVLFDGKRVRDLAMGYKGGKPAWPENIIKLFNGNFDEAAKTLVSKFKEGQEYSDQFLYSVSYWALDCSSGITFERLARYEADSAIDIIGRTYNDYIMGCSVWGNDAGDEFRKNFTTDIPTVFVHGTWDDSTPFENAVELAPFFKNSKLIPLIRGPHGAIRAALEIDEQFKKGLFQFIATGDMSALPDKMEMPPVKWVIPEQHNEKLD